MALAFAVQRYEFFWRKLGDFDLTIDGCGKEGMDGRGQTCGLGLRCLFACFFYFNSPKIELGIRVHATAPNYNDIIHFLCVPKLSEICVADILCGVLIFTLAQDSFNS